MYCSNKLNQQTWIHSYDTEPIVVDGIIKMRKSYIVFI